MIEALEDFIDDHGWIGGALGAICGIALAEYIYVANVYEVRLLFLLIIALVGAFIGGGVVTLVLLFIPWALRALVACAFIGAVVWIVYLLYGVVVWKN